jgi:hypothetical protein
MPSTVEAALILLTLFMPGFLAVRGYSVGRPSAPVTDGLPGLGRALTASMFVLLVGWRLGGHHVYGWMQAGTALTAHESQPYAFAVGLAVLPPVVGFLAADVVDVLTDRVARIQAAVDVASGIDRVCDTRGVCGRMIKRYTQRVIRKRRPRLDPQVDPRLIDWPLTRRERALAEIRPTGTLPPGPHIFRGFVPERPSPPEDDSANDREGNAHGEASGD